MPQLPCCAPPLSASGDSPPVQRPPLRTSAPQLQRPNRHPSSLQRRSRRPTRWSAKPTAQASEAPELAVTEEPTPLPTEEPLALLAPDSVPDAPVSVDAQDHHQSLDVTWSAPPSDGGSDVTEYDIVAIPQSDAAPRPDVVTVGPNRHSATVDSLVNGVRYDVKVRATNHVGSGQPGGAAATPRTVPGSPDIRSVNAADAWALVTWAAPDRDGGASIESFVVRAAPGDGRIEVDADRRSARVSGLANGTARNFTVVARNVAGEGALSGASRTVVPRGIARLTVARQPRGLVVYGDRSRVRAALVTAGGVGVPDQRVVLQAKREKAGRWHTVASGRTGPGGGITLRTTLPASSRLRLRHPASIVAAPDRDLAFGGRREPDHAFGAHPPHADGKDRGRAGSCRPV